VTEASTESGRIPLTTRIPPAVGALLDAAHAEVLAAERALQTARIGLERLVRVHLASTGVDAAGCRIDRDAEGWFHAPVDGRLPRLDEER
jgi:hypothetical protein